MSAQAITVMPLLRPRFNNEFLGNERLWIFYNAKTLADWWDATSIAMGESPKDGLDTLEAWLGVQHDIEMALHGPIAKLPHGAGVL